MIVKDYKQKYELTIPDNWEKASRSLADIISHCSAIYVSSNGRAKLRINVMKPIVSDIDGRREKLKTFADNLGASSELKEVPFYLGGEKNSLCYEATGQHVVGKYISVVHGGKQYEINSLEILPKQNPSIDEILSSFRFL
jgi:hypothetical protein